MANLGQRGLTSMNMKYGCGTRYRGLELRPSLGVEVSYVPYVHTYVYICIRFLGFILGDVYTGKLP